VLFLFDAIFFSATFRVGRIKVEYSMTDHLDELVHEILSELAVQFPVCLSSDEFHFFPQFKSDHDNGGEWEDFSDTGIQRFQARVSRWCRRLDQLRSAQPDSNTDLDVDLLMRVLTTLDEQLRLVCPHKTQPTFYLTIISIGLAESLDQSCDAFGRRIQTLPSFIKAAAENLEQVPAVYTDLALDMIPQLRTWLTLLPMTDAEQRAIMEGLDHYQDRLTKIDPTVGFRLPHDVYARIADFHMGTQMGLEEIAWHLDREIEAAANQLADSAARIASGKTWQTVFQELAAPVATHNDVVALYQSGIDQLKRHCLEQGFTDEHVIADCGVEIQTIPQHLRPIRANAAYSMPPGHPPKGGIFYILPRNRQAVPKDLLLLAAHETFPGHHLLDTHRWRLRQPLRRHLEFPLFYEGWASFSEEILFDTGFFSGPVDQLLMAKRRFWRAQRGRADLRIHTGQWRLEEAAVELSTAGLADYQRALAMVQRYALKPGYQLSYAIGRGKFRQLYNAFAGRGGTPGQFVRQVLSHGEIGFDHLAERLLY
jgi:uncharacterized protein (DUF885 family)